MKLKFDVTGRSQPDPFIFEDGGRFYIYATGGEGVQLYSADDVFGTWHYEGTCASFEGCNTYWAPSVIKHDGKYYMYVSCNRGDKFEEFLRVACADTPYGPFTGEKMLYEHFSIDSHMVETEASLFLWYCLNRFNEDNVGDRIGTRIFVEKFLDPWTPSGEPREVIVPTFDEEIFTPQYTDDSHWHTIEGAFWFEEDGWQYVMYSGGCYQDDTYHIGYSAAKSGDPDLTRVDFVKHTADGAFDPVLIKNEFEEGTGHHSVLKYKGEYYAIYHGRDYGDLDEGYTEARTARICKLHVKDGIITAERYKDHI
ncbi:MAG: family 43 glycosylhydrolase [Oscillospiraceae bacterium]|nr:family 43 glycosylhydrolase [Oscillospiraceae bacterium]